MFVIAQDFPLEFSQDFSFGKNTVNEGKICYSQGKIWWKIQDFPLDIQLWNCILAYSYARSFCRNTHVPPPPGPARPQPPSRPGQPSLPGLPAMQRSTERLAHASCWAAAFCIYKMLHKSWQLSQISMQTLTVTPSRGSFGFFAWRFQDAAVQRSGGASMTKRWCDWVGAVAWKR